jgi:protease-4
VRADRILAIILITVSLVAATGSWLGKSSRSGGSPLARAPVVPLGRPEAQVAAFDLVGTIANGEANRELGDSGVSATRIVPLLRRAEKDGVKAILLRINSPGGTAAASQAIYDELLRVRKADKIKIVAAFGDVGASGGYYVAAAAHHIMCLPSTTTGSIGVIAHVPNLHGLMVKIGMQDQVFKSGRHKDILSPFRGVDPEERAIIQGIVDDTYRQFINSVIAGRPKLTPAKLRNLADGRIFTGRQALEAGLVDSLGNYSDALAKAAALAGIKGDPVTRDYTEESFLDYLLKLDTRSPRQIELNVGPVRTLASRFPARVPLALMD